VMIPHTLQGESGSIPIQTASVGAGCTNWRTHISIHSLPVCAASYGLVLIRNHTFTSSAPHPRVHAGPAIPRGSCFFDPLANSSSIRRRRCMCRRARRG
jgi:hypothetical protein